MYHFVPKSQDEFDQRIAEAPGWPSALKDYHLSQTINSVWVQLPQMTMVRASPNVTLDGDQALKPYIWHTYLNTKHTKKSHHFSYWIRLYELVLFGHC